MKKNLSLAAILNRENEPYRYLFPVASLLGILGAFLWLFLQWRWVAFYPRVAHGNLMYFGLIWTFIAGFLMTAIPKMTGTSPAKPWEISLAAIMPLGQLLLNFLNQTDISIYLFAIQIIFLVIFILQRFLVKKRIPFSGFMFLPLAFTQALLGVALFVISGAVNREAVTLLCGEAFILNLIVGLGSRLVPVISRLPNALLPSEASTNETWLLPSIVAVLLNLSYILQIAGYSRIGVVLRVIALALGFVKLLKLFTKPVRWNVVGIGLKAALVFILVGTALSYPNLHTGLAGLHFLYIGGFALVTFLISIRVLLSHGEQDLSYEISSKRIAAIILLFSFSAVLRFVSGVQVMSFLITVSVLAFSLAIVLWLIKFFSVLLSSKNTGE